MPLSINVGLSRKASRDYQSTGVSINLTAELHQSLLARPDELQQQIGNLYAQAQHAMERQVTSMSEPAQSENRPTRSNGRYERNGGDRGYANGNRQAKGQSSSHGGGITESQRRAIFAIAGRVGVDAAKEACDFIGTELDALSIREASELIDHLKAIQPTGNGR